MYAFTRQQPGCFNENAKLVTGSQGQLQTSRGYGISGLDGKTRWTSAPEQTQPELTTFREMFDGIRSGNPINDSLSMARSTMHAILGRMATHSGQRVTWDEAFASSVVLAPQSYAWDARPPVLPGPEGKYPSPIPGVAKALY